MNALWSIHTNSTTYKLTSRLQTLAKSLALRKQKQSCLWRLKRPPTRAGSCRTPRAGCASPSSSGSGRRTSSRALWARPGCSWPSRSCPAPAGATGTRFSLVDERLSRAAAPRRSQGNCTGHMRAWLAFRWCGMLKQTAFDQQFKTQMKGRTETWC